MARSEITMMIAKVAHECWCRHMVEQGWTPGDRYDPVARIHDAIRPFDELSPFDQDYVGRTAQFEEFEKRMCETVDFSRGPSREFAANEMRVGLPVTPAGDGVDKDPAWRNVRSGRVISWEIEDADAGTLSIIRVEWENDQVVEHPASACELARPDEA